MKLFTLISNQDVHPEKKIIPAKEFSSLHKASSLLKKVKQEAKKYKLDVAQEAEAIKEQAAKEGFEEGLEKLNKHILKLDKEIKTIRDEFEKKMIPIALKAAKKILGEELSLHPERIADIVIQALKPVTQHKQIKIYANKEDLSYLEEAKRSIKEKLENIETLEISERDDIEKGGCIIETEAGIINAQLENQWRALEAAFKSLAKGK